MTPPPPPPNPDPPDSRSAPLALAVVLVVLLGLLAYRGYGDRFRTRPTEPVAPGRVDLATADAAELEQLPGIGPKRAKAIVTARAAAPLDEPADLRRVPGFGPAAVEQLRPFVKADAPAATDPPLEERKKPAPVKTAAKGGKLRPGDPPVNVNEAAEAELQRIPGVGPVMAGAIVAARPFKTVDDLDRVKGIGPKTLEKFRPFVTVE